MTSSRTKGEREKRRGLVAVRSISNRGGLLNRGKLRRSFSLPLPLSLFLCFSIVVQNERDNGKESVK